MMWIVAAAVSVIVCAMLIGFTAWLRFFDDDDKVRRDFNVRGDPSLGWVDKSYLIKPAKQE